MVGYEESDARVVCDVCGWRPLGDKRYRAGVLAAKLIFYVGVVLVLIGGITSVSLLASSGAETHLVGWFVAFAFAAVAVITSLYDISRHLLFYVDPPLQLHYVRILWMVVIYAVESWLSLRYRTTAIYLETAREAYEAFVLWSFYRLLLSYLAAEHGVGWTITAADGTAKTLVTRNDAIEAGLGTDAVMGALMRHSCNEAIERREAREELALGEDDGAVCLSMSGQGATPKAAVTPTTGGTRGRRDEEDGEEAEEADAEGGADGEDGKADLYSPHIFPFCCLPSWRIGTPFLHWTRLAVFQYVVVRLVFTVLALILTPLDLYGEGEFNNPGKLYLYSVVAMNLSQCWALYCLALVYFRFHTALEGIQPTRKFLVIKALVFLCWWQSLVVAGMGNAGWLQGTQQWTSDEVQRGLQDFLICVEMAGIAAVHHRVYSYLDFVPKATDAAPLLAGSGSGSGPDGRVVVAHKGADGAQAPAIEVGSMHATQPKSGSAPKRQPFLAAVANMMPGDVVRDVPRVLGQRQRSDQRLVISPPSSATPASSPEARPETGGKDGE